MKNNVELIHLLQLASPTLPVGAYSYSEGLEALIDRGAISNKENLQQWIEHELKYGAIRIEAAVMLRAAQSFSSGNMPGAAAWNDWLSASRETEELRQQSWQMGKSLLGLLVDLEPELQYVVSSIGYPCNYAVAFGIAAAHWQIDLRATAIGYLHSWASNLIGASVKLIPLGQTAGQQLLHGLRDLILEITEAVFHCSDEELSSCSWGLALFSMAHETQYTRLFRS